MIIGLARYGGLQCPSELAGLRWCEIYFDKGQFIVHSPKTERYEGKAMRIVPLFSELLPLFRELWDELPEGNVDWIFPDFTETTSLGAKNQRIQRRAGTDISDLFRNFRFSRRKELKRDLKYAEFVDKIMGHDTETGNQYYGYETTEDEDRFNVLCKTLTGNSDRYAERGK